MHTILARTAGCLILLLWGLTSDSVRAQTTPAVRIWPVGDSITLGCCSDSPVEGGYRTELYTRLQTAGYNVEFVGSLFDHNPPAALGSPHHEGHGGFRIDEIDAGIEDWISGLNDPDVVLLLIGVNDFLQTYDTTHAINRLESLIAHIATLRPNAKIVVANLLQVVSNPTLDSTIQTQFNQFVPGVVAHQDSLGHQVSFVDLRSCCSAGDFSSDGLHPNQTGYGKIGDTWYSGVTGVISPLGTTNPPAILRAEGQVDLQHVLVTFTKPVADSSANIANYSLNGGVTILSGSLDSTKRVVTLVTSQQAPATSYTLTVSGVIDRTAQANVIAPGTTVAFQSGPAAEGLNYALVYSLNIPDQANYGGTGVPYAVDNHNTVGAFSRIAYYLQLQPDGGGARQYVWVSMDAFTTDPGKIGVPTFESGGFFRQLVTHMNVRSSVPGIVVGDGISTGNIEFWWGNYDQSNSAGIPGASSSLFDWGDNTAATYPQGYGSMQVHNYGAGQTIFAYNAWGFSTVISDLGIGNYTGQNPDWTYAGNANTYIIKKLQVYVLPIPNTTILTVSSVNPSVGINVTVSPSDVNGAGNGVTEFSRFYTQGSVVTLTAPATATGVTFQKWQIDGSDLSTSTSVSVTMNASHDLRAVYVSGADAVGLVSEAASYSLVYSLLLPDNANYTTSPVPYEVDRHTSIGPFSRIGYLVELENGGALNYVWVSTEAFTSDPSKIGVPTLQSGALFQQRITNMTVQSSVSGIVNGTGITTGNLEFWPYSYFPNNTAAVPGASDSAFDWGDSFSTAYPPLGSMQIHNWGAGQTLFAFNLWADGNICDLGIGNASGSSTDWSDAANAGYYTFKKLQVYVLPSSAPSLLTVGSSSPGSGVPITVSPADTQGQGNGVTGFSRSYVTGTVVNLTTPSSVGANPFQKWQKDGVDAGTSPSITLTVNGNHSLNAIYTPGPLAPRNVAEAANYTLVYSLDLPNVATYNATGVPYALDAHASVGPFSRIAYYLELQPTGGSTQYVWVSMNAFTADASKIGVPTIQSGSFFQQSLSSMNVRSSVPGIATGDGLSGGNIEFWGANYDMSNSAGVPGASDSLYDWGDHVGSPTVGGYGSMQVHNHAAGQTIFAFNDWGSYTMGCDIGIGNYSGQNPDWTYANNASSYVYKEMQVYVLPTRSLTVNSSNPNSGVSITVSPGDNNAAGNGLTPFGRVYNNGAVVTLTAPVTAGGNNFQKWQVNGADFSTSASINLTMTANNTATAVYTTPTLTTFSLSVTSSSPGSGVSIGISPPDNNGAGTGATPLGHVYNSGTVVTLTAPATATGNNFQKWQQDGVDAGTSLSINVTMNANHALKAVYFPGPLAPKNVAEAANYSLVYSLDLPNVATYNTTGVPYALDAHASAGPFSRIAYYLELQTSGASVQYLWVSMNAFTTDASKIGVPTVPSGGFFQQNLGNLNVQSSVPGIVTGTGLSGGNIEFWGSDYGPSNVASVPGASSTLFDWGDGTSSPTTPGYGSMQVHNYAAGQTIFAFNDWGSYTAGCDLGIGNYSGQNPDWTYANNASSYVYKEMQIYVLPTRTLTVNSSNPNSGVSITVSPADNNGTTTGSTPFSRVYNNGAVVTLTAPATAAGNNFQKWQVNGADFSTSASINLTMSANTTATAVYVTAPPPTFTLSVNSSNPASGVSITVSPNDNNGTGTGTTPFSRVYNSGTVVTLTAPATAAGNNFQKWQVNGADFSTSASITLTVSANTTVTAVYVTPPTIFTLTVTSSNPNSGVNITVSPSDTNGNGSGTTPFTRSYVSGAVTLTAPAKARTKHFLKWQQDSVDVSTSLTIGVTMDSSHTMTAVYH